MPVTIRVPASVFGLLREVLEKRAPELLTGLREGRDLVIEESQRPGIQELLCDELVETGLRGDHEPNARGHALEALIDVFSPYA